jgi:hypothetical protein
MPLDVSAAAGTNYTQWPRIMTFSASYSVPSPADPHDTAQYVVDYGDGASSPMTSGGVTCGVDGCAECPPDVAPRETCSARWSAPDHTYTVPKMYVATLLKNGVALTTTRFLAFADDMSTTTSSGTPGPAGPVGQAPLTVSFTFTGGTSIDFGDGTPPQKLCDCTTWSTTPHQLQHTYACPSASTINPVVSFQDLTMEGAQISVIADPVPTVTSLSPAAGPPGTPVTVTGTLFAPTGTVSFYEDSYPTPLGFEVRSPSVSPDGKSLTFSIPADAVRSTYSVFFTNSANVQSNVWPFTVQ